MAIWEERSNERISVTERVRGNGEERYVFRSLEEEDWMSALVLLFP